MSALPQKRTNGETSREVLLVPQPDSCSAANSSLFDDLVGAGEQRGWHVEGEGFRGIQIDHQFEFGGQLNRQVPRLFAFENTVDVDCRGGRARQKQGSSQWIVKSWKKRRGARPSRSRRAGAGSSAQSLLRTEKSSDAARTACC